MIIPLENNGDTVRQCLFFQEPLLIGSPKALPDLKLRPILVYSVGVIQDNSEENDAEMSRRRQISVTEHDLFGRLTCGASSVVSNCWIWAGGQVRRQVSCVYKEDIEAQQTKLDVETWWYLSVFPPSPCALAQ